MARARLTTTEFIRRSECKYPNLYDYSRVDYVDMKTPIKLICGVHGEFKQTPHTHLHYGGCSKCKYDKQRTTFPEFIEKSRAVHGSKYNYTQVSYLNNKTLVKIICNIHGSFNQLPLNHLNGMGCNKCKYENQLLTTAQFTKRSNIIHNNEYDYSKSNYLGHKYKIMIICKKHGKFNQLAGDHLSGSGCPSCANRSYSKKEISWLTTLNNKNIQHAENGGQIQLPSTKLKVDGFDKTTNTVYEFYGDVFHGNPDKFNSTDLCHPYDDTVTAGELYNKTKDRELQIVKLGYGLITMWEYDYDMRGKRHGA